MIAEDALNLINRQKAEVEDLQNELYVVKFKNSDLQSTYQALKIDLESMRSAANSYKIHYDNAQAEVYELQKLLDLSNKLLDKKQKEMEGGSNE